MAVSMKNAASINVMLKFMAKFEYAVFRTFGRIVPELIQYSAFKDLIEGQTFSSIQLNNKNQLRVREKLSDDVVAQSISPTSYIDNVYYKNKLDE